MSTVRRSVKTVLVGGVAAVVLAVGSVAALAAATGSLHRAAPGLPLPARAALPASCTAPRLPGAVVDVRLADMGGPRMMGMMGRWRGHMLQVRLDRDRVAAGTVSLRVSNVGVMEHELVVLPLRGDAVAGERVVHADGRVDESGSLGEVSRGCGSDAGEGLRPGDVGWTTLQLRPGRYELVCNLPGHYAAGMFAELEVTR